MVTDTQVSELFSYVLELAATQLATLRLLRDLGVDPKKIDEEIRKELSRMAQVPVVADLHARKDPAQLSTILNTVKSVRWDRQ